MTVSTTHVRTGPYAGNGVSTAFPVDFEFYAPADLVVIERDTATGAETVKTLTTHYTVSGGAGGTGTVTAVAPPPSGMSWTIVRQTARTQTTAFVDADSLPAKSLEDGFDRSVMLAQEAADRATRSIRLPDSDSSGIATLLPASQARAGRALVFDSLGNVGVSSDAYVDQTAAAAGSAGAAHASEIAAAGSAGAAHASEIAAAGSAGAAHASEIAAAGSAGAAHVSEVAAAGSAGAAHASEVAAAAALAAMGAALVATSSTSTVTIAVGVKTLAIETGKGFTAGMWVVATDAANAANSMTGRVTSHNATTGMLVLEVASGDAVGSGTPAAWTVGISGRTGPAGPAFVGGTLTSALQTVAGTLGALGLQFGETASGIYRVSAGVWAAVAGGIEAFRILATGAMVWKKAARPTPVAIAYAATVTPDLDAGNAFVLAALTGSPTLANPANIATAVGQRFTVQITQDGTGGRVVSFGSYFKFTTTPSQVTTANTTAYLSCVVRSATQVDATYIGGFPS